MSLVKRNFVFIPSLFNDILKPDWFGGTENASGDGPAVNISDTEDAITLVFSVPGRTKADFDVAVDNSVLTVSAFAEKSDEKEVIKYIRREFRPADFVRTFSLSEIVDEDNISASYENGLLTLVLAKKEAMKPNPKRQIALS